MTKLKCASTLNQKLLLKEPTLIDGEVISPILTNLKISSTNSLSSLVKLASDHRALAHGQITTANEFVVVTINLRLPKPTIRFSVGGRN